MSQIVSSFDIGIRHLAYCTMQYDPHEPSGNQFKIYDWNVIDLLEEQSDVKCSFCDYFSYYKIIDNQQVTYLCKRHANKYDHDRLIRHYTMSNTNICEFVKLAIIQLDKIDFSQSEEILIESQPSKNPKMKNLSMALLNYFIIRYMIEKPKQNLREVKFISSRNKLTVYDGPYVECHLKNQHARNKFYSQVYCRYLIRGNLEKCQFLNNFRKKDDLSDAFLQGAWYLMYNWTAGKTKSLKMKLKTKLKLKLKLKMKPKSHSDEQKPPVGRELLKEIKQSQETSQIKIDYNINKFQNLKRGIKPKSDSSNYTLSNLKYLNDRHLLDQTNPNIQKSIEYYFGQRPLNTIFVQDQK